MNLYAFTIPIGPGDKELKGKRPEALLKIGQTVNGIGSRVSNEQYSGSEIVFRRENVFKEYEPFVGKNIAVTDDDLRDYLVSEYGFIKITTTAFDGHKHDEIMEIPKELYPDGWRTDKNKIREQFIHIIECAVNELISGQKLNRPNSYKMREEQVQAVEQTYTYFNSPNADNHFLWNCKMRFGKTFAAYQLAKKMGWTKVFVLTFVPAVEDNWQQELINHVDFTDWQFVQSIKKKSFSSSIISPENIDYNKPFVCFGSLQDYLQTTDTNEIKDKNKWVYNVDWDCIIFDEYHFGAWKEKTKNLVDTSSLFDVESQVLKITSKYYLYLSGTPFRAISSGEFSNEQIYTWTYQDEQKKKQDYEYLGENNPYRMLPKMNMIIYKLTDDISAVMQKTERRDFDLNAFFETDSNCKFKNLNAVRRWLQFIKGNLITNHTGASDKQNELLSFMDDYSKYGDNNNKMPYGDIEYRKVLKHTLWLFESVSSCNAMKEELEKDDFFKNYYTINIAGNNSDSGIKALKPVKTTIDQAQNEDKGTITLSCGRLTTGVTIKEWTAVFMLKNLSSPETYFQSAFRAQSPWTEKEPNDRTREHVIKENCYVVDFAPNRALKQIYDYSQSTSTINKDSVQNLTDFSQFLPIILFDGTQNILNAQDIIEQVTSEDNRIAMESGWLNSGVINYSNLFKLRENKTLLNKICNLTNEKHTKKQTNETDVNKQDDVHDTPKQKSDKTPTDENDFEETKDEDLRKMIDSLMTKVLIYVYVVNPKVKSYKTLVDYIDRDIFMDVIELSFDDFLQLVDCDIINPKLLDVRIIDFRNKENCVV